MCHHFCALVALGYAGRTTAAWSYSGLRLTVSSRRMSVSTLKLYLLCSPRLERDGVPLEFDTRKNTALVAYLAVIG